MTLFDISVALVTMGTILSVVREIIFVQTLNVRNKWDDYWIFYEVNKESEIANNQ